MTFNHTAYLVGLIGLVNEATSAYMSYGLVVWDPTDPSPALYVPLADSASPCIFHNTHSALSCGATQLNPVQFLVFGDNASSIWQLDYGSVCEILLFQCF